VSTTDPAQGDVVEEIELEAAKARYADLGIVAMPCTACGQSPSEDVMRTVAFFQGLLHARNQRLADTLSTIASRERARRATRQ